MTTGVTLLFLSAVDNGICLSYVTSMDYEIN